MILSIDNISLIALLSLIESSAGETIPHLASSIILAPDPSKEAIIGLPQAK